MNVSNFTEKSKDIITIASNITTQNNNAEITDLHMVAAFLQDKNGLVARLLKKMDVDVRLYSGVNANIVFSHRLAAIDDTKDIYEAYDEGFGLHWLSMFEYSHFDDVDLLIICYGNIFASHPYNKSMDLLSMLPDVPKIILGTDLALENGACVTVDNYGSMKAGIAHLIEKHDKKDIAFISGPKVSQSANKRMEAYLDALEEHSLPIRDELIVFGDYLNNIDEIVEELFSKNERIDAIVSSNDEMCNAVYRVAQKHGRKVGVDLAVVGFDDEEYAKEMDPPLTTVKQDYTKVAEGLVEMIRAFKRGEEISSMRIPASCVQRRSCGCSYETVSMKLSGGSTSLNLERYMTHNEQHEMFQRNMIAALVLRNLLTETISRRAFFTKLAKEFREVGVRSSHILLLENPVRLTEGEKFVLPGTLRLYMRQDRDQCKGFDLEDAPVVRRREITKHIEQKDRWTRTATSMSWPR